MCGRGGGGGEGGANTGVGPEQSSGRSRRRVWLSGVANRYLGAVPVVGFTET